MNTNLTTGTATVNHITPFVGPACPPVWSAMCRAEPRLAALASELRAMRPGRENFWPRWEGYRFRIGRMAGWDADNPALVTSDHYETAVRILFKEYSRTGTRNDNQRLSNLERS